MVLFLNGRIVWRGSLNELVASLCTAIHHLCRNILKHERRSVLDDSLDLREISRDGNQPDIALDLEIDVEGALAQLPPAMGAAVVACYMNRYTAGEFSQEEGVAEATVRTQLRRSKPRLRETLGAYRPSE